ncbi:MAG TPA: DNA mismatch repair protein MutS, partial [Spirochaetia bacterium]|nr:DNA mismatch repair protein MutS [Spirochaetia bacterium]
LHELLTQKGEPTCFPLPMGRGTRALAFEGLYDACLALKLEQRVVANDANAQGKDLVIITGANRGGKSTFLRSIGLAQLMMQAGAFVPAKSFTSDLSHGLFSHFKREEDTTMKSGKLDEELKRMSEIVDHLSSDCTVLFNESFSATNEREGSEISRQIVSALLEKRVKVFFVTHQYEFAQSLYEKKMANALFLRAERKEGGERTFKVSQGEPLETSYGEDLYDRIFLGAAPNPASAAPMTSR